jgi:hypothetical protein
MILGNGTYKVGDKNVLKMYQGANQRFAAGTPWTLVMIPDTQKIFAESCIVNNSDPDGEEIFRQMGAYIAAQKTARNIKQIMHVGDVVNNSGSSAQFALVEAGRDAIIASDIPYTYTAGNHDYAGDALSGRDLTNFNSFFPLSSISGKSWYGGAYDSGSENVYTIQTIDNKKWMFLSVEFYPRTEVMTWMNSVIASEEPDFCVVATHAYLMPDRPDPLPPESFWDGRLLQDGDQYGPNAYSSSFTTSGQDLYDDVISQNDCIVLVLCGHVLDPRHSPNDEEPGTNLGSVAHSGLQFTHANGNKCTAIVYNHQNDGIPPCNDNRQGTTPALHFFEINTTNRTVNLTAYDPVFDVDIATLGNYPTGRPDWEARHNVTFTY